MNLAFQRAIELLDAENAKDPNQEIVDGQPIGRELLYAQRLTDWVLRLEPDASEALRLAARSQHICRWKVPRANYPADRAGYHRWRNELKRLHAAETQRILQSAGCGSELIAQVRSLNLKENFPGDREAQILEDALCLVFLQYQLGALAEKTERSKVINALRKSWAKMSEMGRAEAQRLPLNTVEKELITEALAPAENLSEPESRASRTGESFFQS